MASGERGISGTPNNGTVEREVGGFCRPTSRRFGTWMFSDKKFSKDNGAVDLVVRKSLRRFFSAALFIIYFALFGIDLIIVAAFVGCKNLILKTLRNGAIIKKN